MAETGQRECSVLGCKIFSKLSGKEQVRVECCPESVEMVLWIIYDENTVTRARSLQGVNSLVSKPVFKDRNSSMI